jgi:archaellin
MPYTWDETYILTMEVPQGYTVDELPKQMVVKLDEKESAYFEYRISQSGSTISLRSRVKFNRTLFTNEEYENLREFFNMIVNKQSEQIVFKKKK